MRMREWKYENLRMERGNRAASCDLTSLEVKGTNMPTAPERVV